MDLIGDASKARIIAFIIDNLLACLLAILTAGLIHAENGILAGAIVCFTYLAYFFFFELLWSRTPGKFTQGLVVRNIDGTRCNLKGHLLRTLARILEANPILLGGIPAGVVIFSLPTRQRLGDLMAGTVVISRKDATD
ncbi:MAG: hypothetical protein QOK48_1468 [Blastocatellia bacterium]|jgi:uncharacterized RDD family membrane protein YckC|nr:hypothetical protein [Blastocatellia bacterium]